MADLMASSVLSTHVFPINSPHFVCFRRKVISAVVAAGNCYAVHIRPCHRPCEMGAQAEVVDRFDFGFGRDQHRFQHRFLGEVIIHGHNQINGSGFD